MSVDPPLSADERRLLGWYRQLIDELPMPVFFKDVEGRYVEFNQRFHDEYETRGSALTREELLGTSDFDHMTAAEAELYHEKDQQVVAGQAIRGLEEQLERGDGGMAFFSTTKIPVTDPDGSAGGLVGFSLDYAPGSGADEALIASERRHRLALRGSRDGIWEYDNTSRRILLNDRSRHLFGMPFEDHHVDVDSFLGSLTAATRDELRFAIKRVIADPTELVDVHFEYLHPDAGTRTMHLTGAALLETGSITSIIGSIADVTDAVESEKQLRYLALHDDLTGLSNRRALIEHIDGAIASGSAWSLLFCDLDDFKLVNDSLGHQVGDDLLRFVASTLESTVGPDDFVARLGGDEFAILTPRSADGLPVVELCDNILEAVSQRVQLGGTSLYTTVSIGVVSLDGYTRSGTLLRDADTALYRAKENKSGARWFVPEMRQRAVSTQRLHTGVHQALDRNEFRLVYQPIVDANRRRLTAVEALLRWDRPDGSIAAPASFLPFLERSGLIIDVGEWVVDEVCSQIVTWRDEHDLWELPVSINLSRVQLREGNLLDRIDSIVDRHGVAYDSLIFEVTETAIADDEDAMASILTDLRKEGARVAIDDFGVGQSCLGQLEELPVDALKIDRLFINRLAEADRPQPILTSMLWLAQNLGLTVVAEGVEHATQAGWLTDGGCDHLQGFGFDRPLMPADVVSRSREGHPDGLYLGI